MTNTSKSTGTLLAGLLTFTLALPAAAQVSPPWTTTGSGATQDCNTGRGECALRLDPQPCGSRAKAEQSLNLSTEGRRLTLSFSVRLDSTSGNTDSGFVIHLANGATYSLGFSDGVYSPNNGMELVHSSASGTSERTGVFKYLSAGTWHDVTLTIDPILGVTATVDGTTSPALSAPGATTLSGVELNSVYWCGAPSSGFSFDRFGVSAAYPF